MSVHVKVFIAVLVLGIVGIVGARFALPKIKDALERSTSDAAATQGTLTVGVDSWIGYFPLCSPEMAKRMRTLGYVFRCEDDKADTAGRFARMKEGTLDLAVATVDSYILNGAAQDYPGAIVAVLDESRGGDAIVARRSSVASLDQLKRMPAARIAFTPKSPSEHLMKAIGAHFDIPAFRRGGGKRIETDGSTAALDALQNNKVDVAVLWEPDVSRALADPKFVKLIGTEDTHGLIVDVLVISRTLLAEKPDAMQSLLEQYFQTLRFYNDNGDKLRADVAQATGLPAPQVEAMLQGVSWATLNDNGAQWFGVTPSGLPGDEGLMESINASVAILRGAGDFDRNPLPAEDPYRITNRQFVGALYLAQNGGKATASTGDPLARPFKPLDDDGWSKLRQVGTMKIEPIGFTRGTANMDDDARAALDRIAERLRHYPNYRIVVAGHTAASGDADANVTLSKERAQAVAEYLLNTYRIDTNRIRALGYGGGKPLPREADESDRAYAYRLPRVEVALVGESY